jgi:hypothetical protein
MEAEREIKTFEVNLKCPDCEVVMIRYNINNSIYISSKEIYKYLCLRCEYSIESEIKYPHLKYISK